MSENPQPSPQQPSPQNPLYGGTHEPPPAFGYPSEPYSGPGYAQPTPYVPASTPPPPAKPPVSRGRKPAPHPSGGGCYRSLAVAMFLLAIPLATPYIAEQIAYRLARGKARAEAEVARELLSEIPDAENRLAFVAKSVTPSVVAIETQGALVLSTDGGPLFGNPNQEVAGEGSGVLIDKQGHIVTNYHVIEDATVISIRLSDGQTIEEAEVVGFNTDTDLAVLKIDMTGINLIPIEWGDSDELEVGDAVLAVGSPYGLNLTVTSGIISSTDRYISLSESDTFQYFLQTDAAINQGNSGGPLVNMRGELIGINTAILGETNQGIGFAIPSRLARHIIEQLIENRVASLGWLGVSMAEVSRDDVARLDLATRKGVLVADVVPNSPASRAGFLPNDVIRRWGDQDVLGSTDLFRAVVRTKPGLSMDVLVVRNSEERTISVTVGSRPSF
jgi:serine protease Do